MVTTLKEEPLSSISYKERLYSRFDEYELSNAKSKKYFRVMKEFLNKQEERGVKIDYLCTENYIKGSGRVLWFYLDGPTKECENTKNGIWNIASQIREDKSPVVSLEYNKNTGYSSVGTPTCCPYFG